MKSSLIDLSSISKPITFSVLYILNSWSQFRRAGNIQVISVFRLQVFLYQYPDAQRRKTCQLPLVLNIPLKTKIYHLNDSCNFISKRNSLIDLSSTNNPKKHAWFSILNTRSHLRITRCNQVRSGIRFQ